MEKGKKIGIRIRIVIIAFFAMVFFGLMLVSQTVNISAISESEQKCIDAIPEDMTYAERQVALKICTSKEISKQVGATKQAPADAKQATDILQTEQDVNVCLTRYIVFKRVEEQVFKRLYPDPLANACIKLYNDELWNYQGDDRFEKLVEKYLEISYEDIPGMISYHNALADCDKLEYPREVVDCRDQIAMKFVYQKSKEPDILTDVSR